MRCYHVIIQFAIFPVDERGFVCKRLFNPFFLEPIVHRILLINVMDAKKNLNRRTKRSKGAEENYWDCSVCTYRNTAEAFKCLMCDVRKGTSTRKPRFNPQLVAQQVAQQYPQSQPKHKSSSSKPERDKKSPGDKAAKKIRPRLKNVDRSSAQQKAVTVNNVTVIITEFQPKRRMSSDTTANGPQSSSGNSTDSSQSDSASHSEAQNGDSQSDRR